MKKYIIGLFLISIFLITSGAICSKTGQMPDEIELTYWSAEHDEDDIKDIISSFEAIYPYVDIEYKKFNYDEYEDALINAWAKNQGPDIFSIPNAHVKKYYDYIYPLPQYVTVTTVEETSTLGKKELAIQEVKQSAVSPSELNSQYIDAVYKDVVFKHKSPEEKEETSKIFGLPLSMDTLALYWNKDMLNQASISMPPSDWQSVVDHTKIITKIDKENNIIQSGIALGTSSNINDYFDILSILMMQFGATMTTEQGSVSFHQATEEKQYPGREALEFYTKFAQEKWETYTWNDSKTGALDSFATGNLAYFIGYHRDLEQIKQLNPNLNFDIASLPQITADAQINYASYWVESVYANSPNQDIAWAFVQHLTNEKNSQKYLETAEKPTARRNLINDQMEDYELAVFAEQGLTAQSWYHGDNPGEAKNLFAQMINDALEGNFTIEDIVNDTARKVQLTFEEWKK